MLVTFETKGYKLFDENVEFSMVADNNKKKLSENINNIKIKDVDFEILKSAIIFGPNNSGKTTFIKAITLLKSIIIEENVNNACKDKLNFNFFEEEKKIEFKIEFIKKDNFYSYSLSFNNKCEIINEILKVNGEFILDRNGKNCPDITKIIDLLGHYKNKLLVTTLPKKYHNFVIDFKTFFDELIILQYSDDQIKSTLEILDNALYRKDFLNFIKTSDTSIRNISINNNISPENFPEVPKNIADYLKLESTYEKNGSSISLPSLLVDSIGTRKLIVYASYIIKAMRENLVLIIDELDSSWHTMITKNIYALFNNKKNVNSQLIASCHDLLLLDDENMFRRDQIWFTYKDNATTYFYSLADFKDNNLKKPLVDYLQGRLGSLPHPNFGIILKDDE